MYKKILSLKRYISINDFLQFWKGLYKNRKIISQMVKRDFKTQFLGSMLGIFWAFIQPLIFVVTLWFVFALGFRQGRGAEPVPFVLWLMTGMFSWFFVAECIKRGTGSITIHSYLVSKIKFQVSMLPLVTILSSLLVHATFILMLFLLFIANGYWPTLYWLQIFYYLLAAIMFTLGLTWISSALNVFMKDVDQIAGIIVRLGFWFTPIFWKVERLPEEFQFFVQFNPAYYFVQGYRDSLIYNVGFWEKPFLTIYFWTFTSMLFIVGAIVFKRLRPHFADVL